MFESWIGRTSSATACGGLGRSLRQRHVAGLPAGVEAASPALRRTSTFLDQPGVPLLSRDGVLGDARLTAEALPAGRRPAPTRRPEDSGALRGDLAQAVARLRSADGRFGDAARSDVRLPGVASPTTGNGATTARSTRDLLPKLLDVADASSRSRERVGPPRRGRWRSAERCRWRRRRAGSALQEAIAGDRAVTIRIAADVKDNTCRRT
jgi:hypothetical protein